MRARQAIVSFGMSLLAFAAATVACEVAIRVLDSIPLVRLRLPAAKLTRAAPAQALDATLGGHPLPPHVDPAWLDVSPPPLARGKVDPELARRLALARGTGINPFEMIRIWNRRFVEQFGCRPGSIFHTMPPPILVFDPPGSDNLPPYRYPPSQTLPGGLVTNRFGWRGPDLPLDKPPRTVRLAFVGASTTVGLYHLPFSYPEYVVHWLNLWAEHSGLDVRFDGINAGREGLGSSSIAAVIRQELPPAEPDLVLYYEGANQSLCVQPDRAAPPRPPRRRAAVMIDTVAQSARDYSQLARRLEQLARSVDAHGGNEPDKPSLTSDGESGFGRPVADIPRARLEAPLKHILADLDSARSALADNGAELALSSFIWLVYDGLHLDPLRHALIYKHLNEGCWPYSYADLRRGLELHNEALAQYAASHGLPFLDVAAAFPPDPQLFGDAIHLNADGTRLHAWIVFQKLLPIVRSRLASGAWPRPDQAPQNEHPAINAGRPFQFSCD